MQKQAAKMKSTWKLDKKNLDWKSQPCKKVNDQSQQSKSTQSTVWSTMMSADDMADAMADDVSRWCADNEVDDVT